MNIDNNMENWIEENRKQFNGKSTEQVILYALWVLLGPFDNGHVDIAALRAELNARKTGQN